MGTTRWLEPYSSAQSNGAAITAATATSCLPGNAKFTLSPQFFDTPGKTLRIKAGGKISCVATTPGTARYDVRFISSAGTIVVFDGLAMPLNVTAKTDEGWRLEIELTARSVGTGTQASLAGTGEFKSQALIGGPGNAVAGCGSFVLPYNVAPNIGNGFDSTLQQTVDLFFTQTVGTGSMTLTSFFLDG